MGYPSSDPVLRELLGTLRTSLHQCPELSGVETFTSGLVADFVARYDPDQLITHLGGTGVAAVFNGEEPGPTVLIRAELDALPTETQPVVTARAPATGCAHLCGHDAHMTMVAGLAPMFASQRPARGRVVLLFQPAEETGAGAAAVVTDPRFESIRPDCAFALHNLPRFPAGTVVVNRGVMTSASVGMLLQLQGEPSHAAEPEHGRSPARALSHLLTELPTLNQMDASPYRMVTVTHARMGRYSFGVSPGQATLCATLRATTTEVLIELQAHAQAMANAAVKDDGLVAEVEWLEAFPEIKNDARIVELLVNVARDRGCDVVERDIPFRWSDDFGHFARACPSVYFGLGIGEDAAALHTQEYRFPPEIMSVGLDLLYTATTQVLEAGSIELPSTLELDG